MDFMTAVKTCFEKYVKFEGRATRPEFWWFVLFCFVGGIVTGMFGRTLNGLFNLVVLLPSLAVGARRLHDIGKSGWFMLLWLVPVVGWIVMIYWACQPGEGDNRWGAAPAPAPQLQEQPPGAV